MAQVAMSKTQLKFIEQDKCPLCGNKLTTTAPLVQAPSLHSLNCICIPCKSAFLVTWQGKDLDIVSGWQTTLNI